MLYYDIVVGLVFAGVIWLVIEHPPRVRYWRESHSRCRRKRVE